nr:MAG TPA: hypothetical protein [Caudoviricetes sp.]
MCDFMNCQGNMLLPPIQAKEQMLNFLFTRNNR